MKNFDWVQKGILIGCKKKFALKGLKERKDETLIAHEKVRRGEN